MEVTKLLAVCKIIFSILIMIVGAKSSTKISDQQGYLVFRFGNELSFVAQKVNNIDTINLENNSIEKIAERAFKNTSSTEINLQKNELKIIHDMIFYKTDVKRINLQGNKIERIEQGAFFELQLEKLDLSHNKLSYIDDDMFEGLIIAGVLNLSFNKIKKISHLNVFNKNIFYLFLQHNVINSIVKGAFNGMIVHRLDLSSNLLTKIESGTFEGLTTVDLNQELSIGDSKEGLILSYNDIAKIDDNAFKRSKILTIHLDGIGEKVLINKQFWGISESTKIFPDPLVDNEYPEEADSLIFQEQYQDD